MHRTVRDIWDNITRYLSRNNIVTNLQLLRSFLLSHHCHLQPSAESNIIVSKTTWCPIHFTEYLWHCSWKHVMGDYSFSKHFNHTFNILWRPSNTTWTTWEDKRLWSITSNAHRKTEPVLPIDQGFSLGTKGSTGGVASRCRGVSLPLWNHVWCGISRTWCFPCLGVFSPR